MRATSHNILIFRLSLTVLLCACLTCAPSVRAQLPGGPSQPAVEVDLGVLDELAGPDRRGAIIPPGLFPSPRQAGTGAAFEPPRLATPAAPSTPPAEVPVVRPTAGPILAGPAPEPAVPTARGTTSGVKETRSVRPPAESAVTATANQVTRPATKETAQVRPPAEAAVQATAATEQAPSVQANDEVAQQIADGADQADAAPEAAIADAATDVASAETTQTADTVTVAAQGAESPSEPTAPQATPPAVQLPELSIPSNTRAAQLASEDESAATQVQVEAIPAPAPRVITNQRDDQSADASPQTESVEIEQPTVIDGITVPDSETLDELEDGAQQVADSGLPAVDTPALAVPQPDVPASTDAESGAESSQSGPTRVQSTQVAAIPGFEDLRILFAGADAIVGPQGTALIMGLSQRLNRDESLRLQIRAYAGGTPEAATQARRLSLDRALAVRSMLIDQGVRGTRIDIRALGNSAPEEPRDRVDILIQ